MKLEDNFYYFFIKHNTRSRKFKESSFMLLFFACNQMSSFTFHPFLLAVICKFKPNWNVCACKRVLEHQELRDGRILRLKRNIQKCSILQCEVSLLYTNKYSDKNKHARSISLIRCQPDEGKVKWFNKLSSKTSSLNINTKNVSVYISCRTHSTLLLFCF